MLVSVVGLAGTVLGLLLLSIGLFRTGLGPRWVGPALWTFLVVEFVGGALSEYASYVSSVLLLVAFFGLARVLLDLARDDTPTTDS
jgi:prepilin signal peptidase PulO-like enzyme (type II secretory pathway)